MDENGFAIGEQIYKYKLIERIGGGSFGEVWQACDKSVDSIIAVKIIPSLQENVIEKLKEARIGSQLTHPNLVKVHYADVVDYGNTPLAIIVMDNLSNGSILNRVNSCGFLPICETTRLLIEILRGLEYLHTRNVFHNDIKPSNILIGPNGEGILTDYGISCFSMNLQPTKPDDSYLIHCAPETIKTGEISILTDIYQVGITAFRLFNGVDAIKAKCQEKNIRNREEFDELVINGIFNSKDYLPFIPISVKKIINMSIHPNPSKRYQSALEMRRALEKLSFPGQWTCNNDGQLYGEDAKNLYRFIVNEISNGKFHFVTLRKNKHSKRETKVSKFCEKGISWSEMDKLKREMMQAVVLGSL